MHTWAQVVLVRQILQVVQEGVQAVFLPPTSQPPLQACLLACQAQCEINRVLPDTSSLHWLIAHRPQTEQGIDCQELLPTKYKN